MDELMVLLGSDGCSTDIVAMALKKLKKDYVMKYHQSAFTCIAKGKKEGWWKTYVFTEEGRKEVLRKTEDALVETLYDFYQNGSQSKKTLTQVFDLLEKYKSDNLNRSKQTVYVDRQRFAQISQALREADIQDITAEDIQKWLVKEFLAKKPKEDALRKMFQLFSQIFDYGVMKRFCQMNPMQFVSIRDYVRMCDLSVKDDEERQFSQEELAKLRKLAEMKKQNPRALMMLMAMETGMRAGELVALHKTDIKDEYIHVHRQQKRDKNEEGHEIIVELGYTKDERMHPHNGRWVPITEDCRKVMEWALELPGESEYLFHNQEGAMINKASYDRYLNRQCVKIGTKATNNHAFRIALNSRMIELGLSSADRALILGHAVQTNEQIYSVSDRRRLDVIRERLLMRNDPFTQIHSNFIAS